MKSDCATTLQDYIPSGATPSIRILVLDYSPEKELFVCAALYYEWNNEAAFKLRDVVELLWCFPWAVMMVRSAGCSHKRSFSITKSRLCHWWMQMKCRDKRLLEGEDAHVKEELQRKTQYKRGWGCREASSTHRMSHTCDKEEETQGLGKNGRDESRRRQMQKRHTSLILTRWTHYSASIVKEMDRRAV